MAQKNSWEQDKTKGNQAVEYWYNSKLGYSARIKFDGCTELFRHFNGDNNYWGLKEGDYDKIHICGLKDFINMLEDIKDLP